MIHDTVTTTSNKSVGFDLRAIPFCQRFKGGGIRKESGNIWDIFLSNHFLLALDELDPIFTKCSILTKWNSCPC